MSDRPGAMFDPMIRRSISANELSICSGVTIRTVGSDAPSNVAMNFDGKKSQRKLSPYSGRMQGHGMKDAMQSWPSKSGPAPSLSRTASSPVGANGVERFFSAPAIRSPRSPLNRSPRDGFMADDGVRFVDSQGQALGRGGSLTPCRSEGGLHSPRSVMSEGLFGGASPRGAARRNHSQEIRAKPTHIRTGSECNMQMSSVCSVSGRVSPRCAQDSLWRELFHSENDEQRKPRLLGEGAAIGQRGKASAGIPWRQIPRHDTKGRFDETGDHLHGSPQAAGIKNPHGMVSKRRSQLGDCSPRLGTSKGMAEALAHAHDSDSRRRESLSTVKENVPAIMREPAPQGSPREQWLDTVKRRYEQKYDRPYPEKPGEKPSEKDARTLSGWISPEKPASNGFASRGSTNGTAEDRHRQFKQAKKFAVCDPGGGPLKDKCPYHRQDSEESGRMTHPATPMTRPNLSPKGGLSGGFTDGLSAAHHIKAVAEKVSEARRDHLYPKYQQDDADGSMLNASAGPGDSFVENSGISLGRAQSLKSFSGSTSVQLNNPIHSIRARPATAGGKKQSRWK